MCKRNDNILINTFSAMAMVTLFGSAGIGSMLALVEFIAWVSV